MTDSIKLEVIQKKLSHFCYRRFYQFNFYRNYDVILERLAYEHFIPDEGILMLYFSLMFLITKFIASLLWTLLVFVYLLN
jgi:hypothetical protein